MEDKEEFQRTELSQPGKRCKSEYSDKAHAKFATESWETCIDWYRAVWSAVSTTLISDSRRHRVLQFMAYASSACEVGCMCVMTVPTSQRRLPRRSRTAGEQGSCVVRTQSTISENMSLGVTSCAHASSTQLKCPCLKVKQNTWSVLNWWVFVQICWALVLAPCGVFFLGGCGWDAVCGTHLRVGESHPRL